MCPGQQESAASSAPAGPARTRKGPKWLGAHLAEAAKAAGRTKDTDLAAQYQRLRGRRGAAKVTKAVGHSILVAAYNILHATSPTRISVLTGCSPSSRVQARRLVSQFNTLGYQVILNSIQAA